MELRIRVLELNSYWVQIHKRSSANFQTFFWYLLERYGLIFTNSALRKARTFYQKQHFEKSTAALNTNAAQQELLSSLKFTPCTE